MSPGSPSFGHVLMVRYHAGQCLLPGFDLTFYRRASISAYDPERTLREVATSSTIPIAATS